jgi:hypothetical protein
MFIAVNDKRFVAPSGARCNRLRDKYIALRRSGQQLGVRKSYKHPAPLEHPERAAQKTTSCAKPLLVVRDQRSEVQWTTDSRPLKLLIYCGEKC